MKTFLIAALLLATPLTLASAADKQMHKPRPPEKEKVRIGLPPVTADAPATDLNNLPPPPPIQKLPESPVQLQAECADSRSGAVYTNSNTPNNPCTSGRMDPTTSRWRVGNTPLIIDKKKTDDRK